MFRSSPSGPAPNQGAYSRLQQQDEDEDQDYEELLEAIAHQPNSILIASREHCAVVPPQFQPLPELPSDPPHRESLSSHLPLVTRRFIKNRLAFGQLASAASASSLASLPPVVMADIQNGHMPAHADPMLKEMATRGWTIVRRRRRKQRRGPSGRVGREEAVQTLTASVFVKCDALPSSGPPPLVTMAPIPGTAEEARHFDDPIPVSRDTYAAMVQSVRTAIDQGMQPTRISQGSSGSYFCRDGKGKVVGVFKPKNEEPYGRLNPKWTKWIHRHLFPCCFGRSCLIPNLGYLSESASSLIDRRLGTLIVPHTHVAHLASPAFHYDYLDRRAAHLPPKIGSFQCFLHGFKDANVFLRDHPFPLEPSSSSIRFGRSAVWGGCLGQSDDDDYGDADHHDPGLDEEERGHTSQRNSTASLPPRSPKPPAFRWTPHLQSQFRREFEQMVILDYLIRNTDRGLDNWMIKYCEGEDPSRHPWLAGHPHRMSTSSASSVQSAKTTTTTATDPGQVKRRAPTAHLHIAAIDNGLAFPFKHPDEWRSYPYGWLALPEPLVARPFSEAVRRQFLPLLSDPLWWRDTIQDLRELFGKDADFNDHMFERQVAVLKGQGYNIVRVLKDPTAGPLDLVATERVLVHQEEILIEYDDKVLAQRTPQHADTLSGEEASSPLPATRLPNGQRLRTKRSTSFDASTMAIPHAVPITMEPERMTSPQSSTRRAWKDRVRDRMSLDLGRRKKKKKRPIHEFRRVGSDGELESASDSEEDDSSTRHQVTVIMETIQVVKSRKPYFSCC